MCIHVHVAWVSMTTIKYTMKGNYTTWSNGGL